MAFFKALGFTFNPQFTDKTDDKVKEFSNKQIGDAHRRTEVLTALAVESKAKLQELVDKAIKADGKEAYFPQGLFMFVRNFEDPDGHIWEVFWMDPTKVQKG